MRYPVALLCHAVSLDGCVVWQSGLRRCPAVLRRQTAPWRIPRHAFSLGGVPDFYGGRQRLGGSLDMFSPSAASVVFTAACCAPPLLPTLRYAAGSPDRVRGPLLDFIFSRRGRFHRRDQSRRWRCHRPVQSRAAARAAKTLRREFVIFLSSVSTTITPPLLFAPVAGAGRKTAGGDR